MPELAVPDPRLVDAAMALVARPATRRPLVLGICGAQGSGKSTLARALIQECEGRGLRTAVLSLDDLYLSRQHRRALAEQVHPLFETRGVPGTHDVALGLELFAALDRAEPHPLPRFDKATDEPAPRAGRPFAPGSLDVLVFEGWCVGARAQDAAALERPVNALEETEDADGTWRRSVNAALAGPYAALFARIDRLMLLAAPGFEVVREWRGQQERALAVALPGAPGIMDEPALGRFIAHYERLTRHVLAEMPARADCTAWLDADRSIRSIEHTEKGD